MFDLLDAEYPDAECSLDHHNPLELMVATILSAQCTDVRVNKVTPALFKSFPTAKDYATRPVEELKTYIQTCGFYHNKAKNIQANARILVEKHGGEVPQSLDELVALPGVGRKTANVVLNEGFGQATIAVDTHVFRVSNRTGLTTAKTVLDTERELLRITPNKWAAKAHSYLILHGRYVCKAKKFDCQQCVIINECEYSDKSK